MIPQHIQEQIEREFPILPELVKRKYPDYTTEQCIQRAKDNEYHRIVALRGAQIALGRQWIRVEDGLPEMENMEIERSYRVIVLFNGIVQEGYYSYITKYWFDCRNMIITPTHWQPLPKPPIHE